MNSYYSGKLLDYSSWKQLKDIAPSYGIALTIAIVVYFIKYLPLSPWIVLPLQIVIGLLLLLFLCKITKIKEFNELILLVKPFLNKVTR